MVHMHPLRFGLKLSQHATTEEYREFWQIADDAGFDHTWVMDHLATIGGPETGVIHEGWALLAAMAVTTTRTRIGCMVTGNTYRHPGVLAKIATTVDHLSGGRLEFGLGAAWAEVEHTMFGLQFNTIGERMDRFEEALQIIRSLWTHERTTFDGRHYQLKDAIANPKPVQDPYPPIWIGGSGRKRTLRLTAEYADAWNVAGAPDDATARELHEVLDRHCEDVGRDPASIRRTTQYRPGADADETIRDTERLLGLGFTEVVFVVAQPDAVRNAEAAAKLLPRLRELGAS